jgi:hypothetical protein
MSDPGAAHRLWEQVSGRAQTAASRLRVRSALNPMLWLCGIVSLPCLYAAWFARGVEPIATIFAISGTAPIGITCCLAIYFAVFRPEKLQSEDYQIRHETLELIRQKGSPIQLSPSSLDAIANPVHPANPS